ncbi:MAG TPA: pantetheine-phosphate adenylyltransferase [Candidatus Avichristensenella intestinipullorum]|jgi:pantetheine-phosphate adenylyltransferase|uniref:Phosphopantetheine adenylyltransferase n=1 Tax=Candidatus Avichristensenella intestinipullorum TaxID=2840693 RepID=A0A9D0YW25_9FIRM|nr:pantetheine-phosphate adenylyltransferase [Candidatus Avichristensenella intestinipullorum]
MRTVLYPGSFDPVTLGHMDIIGRAATAFDRVIVGVLYNPDKPSGMLTTAQRVECLREATAGLENVRVAAFSGLLVDAVRACGADAVVRGLRTEGDCDVEMQMARLNRQMGGVETVFLAASPACMHISASMVRQIATMNGSLRGLVPPSLEARLETLLRRTK